MKLTLLTFMCLQYLNTPYRWGSNGPNSFDCSGLVLKALSDVGVFLPDMTAQNLFNFFSKKEMIMQNEPCEDCLLFFGRDTEHISHIAIAVDEKYMIEAGGAGRESTKMNLEELAKKDARVRIKPISNRKDLAAIIKVTY
jgi:cell wall-associated NlpC family hydrolase